MDIGTSMESLGSDVVGSFNLNVWFNSNCYTRAVEEYRPGPGGNNKSSVLAASSFGDVNYKKLLEQKGT